MAGLVIFGGRLDQPTMRRFDSSSAIFLNSSDKVPPVAFELELLRLAVSSSLVKRDFDAQAFIASICAFSAGVAGVEIERHRDDDEAGGLGVVAQRRELLVHRLGVVGCSSSRSC